MQNDLISRQELLKLFENLRDKHETNAISYNALYEVILKQPTAYDVEKVVADVHEYFGIVIDNLKTECVPSEILSYNKDICAIIRRDRKE